MNVIKKKVTSQGNVELSYSISINHETSTGDLLVAISSTFTRFAYATGDVYKVNLDRLEWPKE